MKYVDIDTAVEVYRATLKTTINEIGLCNSFREMLKARAGHYNEIGDCSVCAESNKKHYQEPCVACSWLDDGRENHWRPKKGSNNG
jgi:hypothetical protein